MSGGVSVGMGVPLGPVRRLLEGADEALLAVSYVRPAGVGLLARQVPSGRLIVATDRVTTVDGIAAARRAGLDVRARTEARGAFHPKVWMVRRGSVLSALVGSANMTGGLARNDEGVALLDGDGVQAELVELWATVEGWWQTSNPDAEGLVPAPRVVDVLPHELWQILDAGLRADPVVETATGRRNVVVGWDRTGMTVATGKSGAKGSRVPAWMVETIHAELVARGSVTSTHAQDHHDGLNVHRSSFVLALLARHLPSAFWVDRRPGHVELGLTRSS